MYLLTEVPQAIAVGPTLFTVYINLLLSVGIDGTVIAYVPEKKWPANVLFSLQEMLCQC